LDVLPFAENTTWEDGASIDVEDAVVLVDEVATCEDYDFEVQKAILSPRGLHTLHIFRDDHDDYSEDANATASTTRVSLYPSCAAYPHLGAADFQFAAVHEIKGEVGSYLGDTPWLVGFSPSGTYSVVVMKRMTDGVDLTFTLLLLQYDMKTSKIQTRQLDLPFYINLNKIYSVAIEERYGVVYLSHTRGHLFAVPYA